MQYTYLLNRKIMKNKYILCSKCFHNKGLVIESEKIGIQDNSICLNCKNNNGVKLNESLIQDLIEIFFINGSKNLNNGAFESIYNDNLWVEEII